MDGFELGTTLPGGDEAIEAMSHLTLSSGDPEVQSARVLSMKNLKLLRKRPCSPKYVQELHVIACFGRYHLSHCVGHLQKPLSPLRWAPSKTPIPNVISK